MFIHTSVNPSFGGCFAHVSLNSNLKLFPRFPMFPRFQYRSVSISAKSDSASDAEPRNSSSGSCKGSRKEGVDEMFPIKNSRKPRRGRKSEKTAVEDFVRGSLEQTFASIRGGNSDVIEKMESVLKERVEKRSEESNGGDSSDEENEDEGVREKEMVVEEDSLDWPIDADVGWGIRASEYFEQHSIKNVVGEDGAEIDWEGEIDDSWLKEINCLEWESFAFHPSPLIVLVFERYKRAEDNWKVLKELEKAAQVYWGAKDRLPPRMVKLDINIEKDLAYALKVKSGPQVLFLRGTKIIYREKEIRTADELIRMIAHFYFKAKKPAWVDETAVSGPY